KPAGDGAHLHRPSTHLHFMKLDMIGPRRSGAREAIGGSSFVGDFQIAASDLSAFGRCARPGMTDCERTELVFVGRDRRCGKRKRGGEKKREFHRMTPSEARR